MSQKANALPDERQPKGPWRTMLQDLAALDDDRLNCGYDEKGKHRPSSRIRSNVAECDGCGKLIEYDEGEEQWVRVGVDDELQDCAAEGYAVPGVIA